MGITKSDYFSEAQNATSSQFKALGHPGRIAIMEYLANTQSCVCGDIVDELPLAQATVSQHLKELKQAGLIKGSVSGNSICYCIDSASIKGMLNFLTELIGRSEGDQQQCC